MAKIEKLQNSPSTPTFEQGTEELDWSDWNEYQPEEDEIDWDATGWANEEEQKEPQNRQKPKKEKEKKLLHPNHILERDKDAIWDAIIEIEFHFGEDKALEILEEIYFAYKERKHKGLTIYKDRRALFLHNQKRGK